MPTPNIVDIVIIVSLLIYVLFHIREGFLDLSQRLFAFFGGLVIAFAFYSHVASFVGTYAQLPPGILDAASFLGIFILVQMLLNYFLDKVFSLIPDSIRYSPPSRILAVVPAFIDGLIITALALLVLVVIPIFPMAKQPIEDSHIGSGLVNQISRVEVYIDRVFGRATQETLGFLTIRPDEDEMLKLPFSADNLSIDVESEIRMIELINIERAKVGAPPVVFDATLREVARAHSEDMWQGSYFAHYNLDGDSPFDRMRVGGVRFRAAGENLAMARTVERAHQGLMNSPGHKRNILDPEFGRVGVGVISGGIYGKMFTQNFAD